MSGKRPLVNFPPSEFPPGVRVRVRLGGIWSGGIQPGELTRGGIFLVPQNTLFSRPYWQNLPLFHGSKSPATSIHAAKLSERVYLLLMFTLLNSNYVMKSAFLVQFPFAVNQSFLSTRYFLVYFFKGSSWYVSWYVKGNT